MSESISPEDRALIEHTRNVNKTLSLFVFALQECSDIPSETQCDLAEMLESFADAVRARAAKTPFNGGAAQRADEDHDGALLLDGAVPLQIGASHEPTDTDLSDQVPVRANR